MSGCIPICTSCAGATCANHLSRAVLALSRRSWALSLACSLQAQRRRLLSVCRHATGCTRPSGANDFFLQPWFEPLAARSGLAASQKYASSAWGRNDEKESEGGLLLSLRHVSDLLLCALGIPLQLLLPAGTTARRQGSVLAGMPRAALQGPKKTRSRHVHEELLTPRGARSLRHSPAGHRCFLKACMRRGADS